MTVQIRVDRNLGRFRDRKTGRFLALGDNITRIPVPPDGWLFIIDPPGPSEEEKKQWGEFA